MSGTHMMRKLFLALLTFFVFDGTGYFQPRNLEELGSGDKISFQTSQKW
jgi:hypothetical protein